MNHYITKLHSDQGTIKLFVTAQDEPTARHLIQTAEGCPSSSILSVTPCRDYKPQAGRNQGSAGA